MKQLFGAVVGLFLACGLAQAQVTMSGVGTVKAKPDMAVVTLAVVSEGKTAAEVTAANSKAMKSVLDKVERFGIGEKEIHTSGFQVNPRYTYKDQEEPRLVGFTAHNYVAVTVLDLKILGELLDGAIVGGANRVEGVRYNVQEKTALFDQARTAAFADALRKANLYATAGSFKLGVVKSFSEDRNYNDDGGEGDSAPHLRSQMRPSSDSRTPVQVRGGEMTFQMNVHVVWAVQ